MGSGREVARLCQEHGAYRWIDAGVPVNDLAINDFRADNAQRMDGLRTDNTAALAAAGAIKRQRVAQDGLPRLRTLKMGVGGFRPACNPDGS